MRNPTIEKGSLWRNPKKADYRDRSNIINDLSKNKIYCTVCKEELQIIGDHIDRETIIKFKNEHKKCNNHEI